jgi:tetratricopeptide (TPR) repeat protein
MAHHLSPTNFSISPVVPEVDIQIQEAFDLIERQQSQDAQRRFWGLIEPLNESPDVRKVINIALCQIGFAYTIILDSRQRNSTISVASENLQNAYAWLNDSYCSLPPDVAAGLFRKLAQGYRTLQSLSDKCPDPFEVGGLSTKAQECLRLMQTLDPVLDDELPSLIQPVKHVLDFVTTSVDMPPDVAELETLLNQAAAALKTATAATNNVIEEARKKLNTVFEKLPSLSEKSHQIRLYENLGAQYRTINRIKIDKGGDTEALQKMIACAQKKIGAGGTFNMKLRAEPEQMENEQPSRRGFFPRREPLSLLRVFWYVIAGLWVLMVGAAVAKRWTTKKL